METHIFGKIATNRNTLMKYIKEFRCRKTGAEFLIAPRPIQGRMQSKYFALLDIMEGSDNYSFFTNLKKFEYLDVDEYKKQMQDIKYSWRA